MPIVTIRYNPATVSEELMSKLGTTICLALAVRFSIGEEGHPGHLSRADIEVYFAKTSPIDIGVSDVNIDAEMMHFPERHENFGERAGNLAADLRRLLPDGVGFGLWVKLNNARWKGGKGEFSMTS